METAGSAARVTNPLRICIRREPHGIRLTVELPEGEGYSVCLPPAEFNRLLDLGASVLVGVATHAHMSVLALQTEPEPSWQRHELN